MSGSERLFPGRTAPLSSSAEPGLPERGLNLNFSKINVLKLKLVSSSVFTSSNVNVPCSGSRVGVTQRNLKIEKLNIYCIVKYKIFLEY